MNTFEELTGKYIKKVHGNEWYKIISILYLQAQYKLSLSKTINNKQLINMENINKFDLSNILEYNPETHYDLTEDNIKEWSQLNKIKFNEFNFNNYLLYDEENKIWQLGLNGEIYLETGNIDILIKTLKQNVQNIKYLPKITKAISYELTLLS